MPNSEDSFGSSLTELLPCPFCGGEGHYDNSDVSAHEWIACTVCGATAGVKKWNLRTSPVPAPAPTGWMPFSEAPKDGTRFLAICATGQIRLVRWDDPGGDRYPIADSAGTIWDDAPTHYMPLPAPPADGGVKP